MALVLSHCHPFCLLAAQFSHCSNSLNLIWCIIMAKFIFDSLCKHPVDNIQYHKKCYDIVSSGHCSLHTVPSLVSARGWGGGHGAGGRPRPRTRGCSAPTRSNLCLTYSGRQLNTSSKEVHIHGDFQKYLIYLTLRKPSKKMLSR